MDRGSGRSRAGEEGAALKDPTVAELEAELTRTVKERDRYKAICDWAYAHLPEDLIDRWPDPEENRGSRGKNGENGDTGETMVRTILKVVCEQHQLIAEQAKRLREVGELRDDDIYGGLKPREGEPRGSGPGGRVLTIYEREMRERAESAELQLRQHNENMERVQEEQARAAERQRMSQREKATLNQRIRELEGEKERVEGALAQTAEERDKAQRRLETARRDFERVTAQQDRSGKENPEGCGQHGEGGNGEGQAQ